MRKLAHQPRASALDCRCVSSNFVVEYLIADIHYRASGTLCSSAQKFVARTSRGDLQCFAFPLNSEQVWLPKKIDEVSFVHHIHGGTGFIVGRSGRAEIIDIEATLLTQTLSHENSDTSDITSIAVRFRKFF